MGLSSKIIIVFLPTMSFSAIFYSALTFQESKDNTYPPDAKWSVDQIPDLTGKVYIVTGANTGIGYENVKAILNKNGKVYLGARSESKAKDALKRLKDETGKDAIFLKLDLADLQDVKRAADEFLSKETELHVLFNNAGVMAPPKDQFTTQGWDLQFGVNTVAPFLLTKLLLPILIKTAKNSPPGSVRVLNTSSLAHFWYPYVHYDGVKDTKRRNGMCEIQLYGQSKIAVVMFTNEFSSRYHQSTGIVFTSLNPGSIGTDLQRNMILGRFKGSLHPPSMGAITQLWAGLSDEGKDLDGKYLKPWARIGEVHPNAHKKADCVTLWDFLNESVKQYL